MASYNHQEIEKKWQARWEKDEAWKIEEDQDRAMKKQYVLDMFPYPSAAGLHVGHPKGYTATDIIARKRRMEGFHVLHPMGWDAFGLPAENYAIKVGVHPRESTKTNIETFKRQVKSLGLSYDWSREIATCDPEYYKWTQWMFLFLLEKDLAYRASASVNWCENDQTVLANEQVVDGCCERCKNPVVQKQMSQWFFRITKYADALLEEIERLDWPESIKAMQRNWIGRSEGCEIEFRGLTKEMIGEKGAERLHEVEFSIPVFTTRADTLFGVSYIVLAPEHPLVDTLTTIDNRDAIVAYRDETRRKSELERTQLGKEKSGVFIGAYAKHPLTGEEVPIWVSDYVLMNYGTGAVMGVPAHDERDFAFAKRYALDVRQVVAAPAGVPIDLAHRAFIVPGLLVNSEDFNGLTSGEAKNAIAGALERAQRGKRVVRYRLRDWLVSRQRYWGAPIPVIWCDTCGMQPVPTKDLPVMLPDDVDFRPTGESPLVRSESFHKVNCPKCNAPVRRESDTMDTFVDSSWYFLRYCDPTNTEVFADLEKVGYWCPVDLYVGGAEHAVLHLLYARFFAHALHEHGYLAFREPFTKLRSLGLVLGPDGQKMSKSRGNVINPDEVVADYGADTLRLYEMFMGPFEDASPWDTKGVVGVRRFLDKVAYVANKVGVSEDAALTRQLHKTIKQVGEQIEAFRFNTVVSALMVMTNAMHEAESVPRDVFKTFLKLLAPLAPHLAEELWEKLGHDQTIFAAAWPAFDASLAKDDLVELAIQVNGKLRATISVSPDLAEDEVKARALATENVEKHLADQQIARVVYVPGKLINIVVK